MPKLVDTSHFVIYKQYQKDKSHILLQIRVLGNILKKCWVNKWVNKVLSLVIHLELVALDSYLTKLVSSGILPSINYCMQILNFIFFSQREEDFLCMKNDIFKYEICCLGILYDHFRDWPTKFCLQFLLCETFFTSVQDFRSGLLSSPGEIESLFSFQTRQNFSFLVAMHYCDLPKSWFFIQLWEFPRKMTHVQDSVWGPKRDLLTQLSLNT